MSVFFMKDVFAINWYFAEGTDKYCISYTHTAHLVCIFRRISFLAIAVWGAGILSIYLGHVPYCDQYSRAE